MQSIIHYPSWKMLSCSEIWRQGLCYVLYFEPKNSSRLRTYVVEPDTALFFSHTLDTEHKWKHKRACYMECFFRCIYQNDIKWTTGTTQGGIRTQFLSANDRCGTALPSIVHWPKSYKMDNSERGDWEIRNLFLGHPRPTCYRSVM